MTSKSFDSNSVCPSSPSTSTQKVAFANVYRWDHSPSVLLSSSSASAVNGGHSPSPSSSTELTSSHHNRNARPPTVLPQTNTTCTSSPVAISDSSYNTTYKHSSQDVRYSLNISAASYPSTASSHHGHPPESSLSTSFPHHVSLNRPSSTPHQVPSNLDLAAHYGIPQSLPKPPRTTPRSQASQPVDPIPAFEILSRNYLNMLAQKSDTNMPMEEPPATSSTVVPPADIEAPVIDAAAIQSVADTLLASPQYQDLNSFNEFLTSPFDTPYDDFNTSPLDDSPFTSDLNTPIMDMGLEFAYTGFGDEPLFQDMATSAYSFPPFNAEEIRQAPEQPKEPQPAKPPVTASPASLDMSSLYQFSPETPALDSLPDESVNPSTLTRSARLPVSKEFVPPQPAPRRRSQATGTRKNITPASLVPLEAPTQSRHYTTPSATSRKELPAVFARKRARASAFPDEEDEFDGEGPGPNATEREQIEWKRRQNTLAARKSRKRKLEHQQFLENQVEELKVEVERWKARSQTLEQVLRHNGVPFTFEDSEA